MPAEIFTRTGTQVADAVKRQFGDPDGRQINDFDILGWINLAQQDIVSQNPLLKETGQTNVIKGQDLYTYPTQNIQYIEALHYDGVPLEPYSFQEAQSYILSNLPESGSPEGIPTIWYERAGQVYIFPKPNKNITNGLRMYYVEQPADLTVLTNTLSVPNRYFQRVVDLVLARAYQLDENWEAAAYKQQEYVNAMTLLENQENVVQTNTYPSVTVRIEDL
jgi:hypothetical protein